MSREVVVVSAVRTAIGTFGGSLKDSPPTELGALVVRESLAREVVEAGRDMNERGWVLKIEDGFRSLEMQRQLVRRPSVFDNVLKKCLWELGGEIPTPEFVFRRAIVLTANMPKTRRAKRVERKSPKRARRRM